MKRSLTWAVFGPRQGDIPGVNTQDSKSVYALPDHPMPDDYPEWPSGQQVQA